MISSFRFSCEIFFPVFCIFDKILQKSFYSCVSLTWTQTFLCKKSELLLAATEEL